MESLLSHSVESSDWSTFVFKQKDKPSEESCYMKSCWYCSSPVSNRRTFCSTECREALYDDNEYAKSRRMILGCQC